VTATNINRPAKTSDNCRPAYSTLTGVRRVLRRRTRRDTQSCPRHLLQLLSLLSCSVGASTGLGRSAHPTSVRPQGVISGFGGADEVVLANRSVDREFMPGHVIREGAVGSVDVGVGARVGYAILPSSAHKFTPAGIYRQCSHARSGRAADRTGGRPWLVRGSSVNRSVSKDGPHGGPGRVMYLGGQRRGQFAEGSAIPGQGVGLVDDLGDDRGRRRGEAAVIDVDIPPGADPATPAAR